MAVAALRTLFRAIKKLAGDMTGVWRFVWVAAVATEGLVAWPSVIYGKGIVVSPGVM